MNEFIIVSFLDGSVPHSFNRNAWPFHTTILAPFTTDLSPDEMHNLMQTSVIQLKSFTTKGKSREMFGRDNTVSVTELYKTLELAQLHMTLYGALSSKAAFRSPDWVGENYRPHVTDTESRTLELEEMVYVDTITLVALEPSQGHVLHTLKLGNKLA